MSVIRRMNCAVVEFGCLWSFVVVGTPVYLAMEHTTVEHNATSINDALYSTLNVSGNTSEHNAPSIREAMYNTYKLIGNLIEQLSGDVLDSELNVVVANTVDNIFNCLTDEDLKAVSDDVSKLMTVLQDHGWTGVDFFSPPDRAKLQVALRKLLL